uniref:Cytochrome b6-f complex subunit 8 n=1 Tax=Selaginella erythropus TaxID=137146 RepID=A0A8K2ATD6_9TRAC|nr:cytochrome b6/f complex subunit VIII [Selaginella erythropus]
MDIVNTGRAALMVVSTSPLSLVVRGRSGPR